MPSGTVTPLTTNDSHNKRLENDILLKMSAFRLFSAAIVFFLIINYPSVLKRFIIVSYLKG